MGFMAMGEWATVGGDVVLMDVAGVPLGGPRTRHHAYPLHIRVPSRVCVVEYPVSSRVHLWPPMCAYTCVGMSVGMCVDMCVGM